MSPPRRPLTGASGSCSLTGLTEITIGSQLNATITNTAYKIRVIYKDALGNPKCSDLVGTGMGADFVAPAAVTLTGVTANQAFNNTGTAAGTNYVLASTGDNASGISATTPGLVSILRVNSTGANTCVIGTGAACVATAAAGTASATGGSTGEGYYTLTAQMTDVAGNAGPTPAFSRLFLVDATLPTFTGNVGLAAQYSGNAPAVSRTCRPRITSTSVDCSASWRTRPLASTSSTRRRRSARLEPRWRRRLRATTRSRA